MKTMQISQNDMERRIARFGSLKPLPIQNASIPEKARDVVYSRKLLSVIGLENVNTPINQGAPIVGAAGMTMTLAVCPPGQGPGRGPGNQAPGPFGPRGGGQGTPFGTPFGQGGFGGGRGQ